MEKTVFFQEKAMPAKLFVFHENQTTTYNLSSKTTVGRTSSTSHADISFSAPFVSRNHGCFELDAYGFYYTDTNNSNGSFYNGNKLPENHRQYLKNGDTIQIFQQGQPENFVSIIFLTDYLQSFDWQYFDRLDQIYAIDIGRGGMHKLDMMDNTISINHATFFQNQNVWNVIDHNSTNGVYVNGVRITTQNQLKIGDCIRIANILFVFTGNRILFQRNQSAQPQPTAPYDNVGMPPVSSGVLSIQIVERSVWQKAKKLMLLQDVNMTIKNGELVLILGGSGAGKTTFMNAVMGYEKAEGQITHENHDIYEDFDSIKHKIGFVPQLDLLRGSDTVYDTLYNAGQMKLSAHIKKGALENRIEVVMETLGLTREQKSLVSKLSGGQRKRLSIAIEYIADPSLFFLDEPDSGLDGIMSKTLMRNLRTIANENKIVMVISHAPDRVSELFDKVIVLAKSTEDNCGHLAFFGSVKQALSFFETDCLEGVVQRINRPDEGGDGLSDHYIKKYKAMVQGE